MTRRPAGSRRRATELVTGGTGFPGGSPARGPLADGVPVRVLARSRPMAKPLAAAVIARAEGPRLPSERTPTRAARAAAGLSDRLPCGLRSDDGIVHRTSRCSNE